MLNGETRKHDGLPGEPVLLVDDEWEEQVDVGRVLHVGKLAARLFNYNLVVLLIFVGLLTSVVL